MDTGETGPLKVHAVITAGVVLVTITALAMAARVVARWQLKTLGIDDGSFSYNIESQFRRFRTDISSFNPRELGIYDP